MWRADPLRITEAPRAQGLEVTVENPGRGDFLGRLMVLGEGSAAEGPAVHVRTGQDQIRLLLPQIRKPHQVVLADETGKPVAQTTTARFEAMAGFPAGPDPTTDMSSILFVDNVPQSPRPLSLALAAADAPAPFALEVPYQFDPGWRYLRSPLTRRSTIPAGARGAMVWVRGNRSGDSLRCRFHDATGQTFQVDLARLEWSDWRPLRIDFAAHPGVSHWGGADDGVPHSPLTWEALLLIDSARRGHSQPQSILVASPFYVMGR